MRNTLSVLGRWLAIGGLWLLIMLLTIPIWIAHHITGAGLALLEPLKAKADELVKEARRG